MTGFFFDDPKNFVFPFSVLFDHLDRRDSRNAVLVLEDIISSIRICFDGLARSDGRDSVLVVVNVVSTGIIGPDSLGGGGVFYVIIVLMDMDVIGLNFGKW